MSNTKEDFAKRVTTAARERQQFARTVRFTIRKHNLVTIHHQLQHLHDALIKDGKIYAASRIAGAIGRSECCTMSALIGPGLVFLNLVDKEVVL